MKKIPHALLALQLVASSLAACAAHESPAASEVTPEEMALKNDADERSAEAFVPAPFKPDRNRSWPLLESWLKGKEVSRAPTTGMPLLSSEHLAARGEVLFGMYCYQCHGKEGGGDGPRSPMFDPPPRDLTAGEFKFSSTVSGGLPTREDLFRTITGGLRTTGMMPFADLPEDHRWALVEYVRQLSPRFADPSEAELELLRIPPLPADLDTDARAEVGAEAYAQLGCTECHGDNGRGDGLAAPTLRDSRGNLLPAPDLATRPHKRGDSATSTFLTIAGGLGGTPMPSYVDSATADELWDVIAYVRKLGREGASYVQERDVVEAKQLVDAQLQQGKHAVVDGCGCQARKQQR